MGNSTDNSQLVESMTGQYTSASNLLPVGKYKRLILLIIISATKIFMVSDVYIMQG